MRVLSLDVGERRIGFAVSDAGGTIAQPVKVYKRGSQGQDLEEIAALVRKLEVGQIVVGLPRNLDGSLSERARDIIAFGERIRDAAGVGVEFWDERFSSEEAHRVLDMGAVRHRKRKAFIDVMAAQIILQGYLDAQKQG